MGGKPRRYARGRPRRHMRKKLDEFMRAYDLTPKQEEALRLLVIGMRQDSVCDLMGITRNTLKRHVNGILAETGALTIDTLREAFQCTLWGAEVLHGR